MNIFNNYINTPFYSGFENISNSGNYTAFSCFNEYNNLFSFLPQIPTDFSSIWTCQNTSAFLPQNNSPYLNLMAPKFSFNFGFNNLKSDFVGSINRFCPSLPTFNKYPASGCFGSLTLNNPLKPQMTTGFSPDNSKVKNLSWWKSLGYNEEKGKRLSKECKKWANYAKSRNIKGECVGYVRRGINDAFYGGKQHYKRYGKAWACGDEYLSGDTNFKKINITGLHFEADDIPAGVFILYKNYSSNPAGHGEVSDGNGHGDSDYTSSRLFQCNGRRKEPYQIWIPV